MSHNLLMVTVAETNSLHLKFHGWKTTFLLERPTFGCYVSGRVRDPALTSCYISNPMETMVLLLLSIFLHIRCMISCMKSINYLQVILSFSKHQGHHGHENQNSDVSLQMVIEHMAPWRSIHLQAFIRFGARQMHNTTSCDPRLVDL